MDYLLLDKAIEEYYIALEQYMKTMDKLLKGDIDENKDDILTKINAVSS